MTARPSAINTIATTFLKVNFQEAQKAVAPRTTIANMGTPARETVKTIVKQAKASASAESQRTHLFTVELMAATRMGPTKHTYMERLFAWSSVPETRSTPV